MTQGHFNVLRPIYHGTGQTFTTIDPRTGNPVTREYQRVEWQIKGTALSMDDAKDQFGGRPVLEWVSAKQSKEN